MNMQQKARDWLKEEGFAEYEDEIVECCATYGVVGMGVDVPFFMDRYDLSVYNTARRALLSAAVEHLQGVCIDARKQGKSIVVVTINNEQKIANQALIKAGFIGTPWATRDPKRSPYRTKVRVFTKNVYQPEKEK